MCCIVHIVAALVVLVGATPARADTDAKVGVAECDDYLEKYERCVSSKIPEAGRPAMRSGMELTRAAWRKAAATADGRAALASGCQSALEGAKRATAAFDCDWTSGPASAPATAPASAPASAPVRPVDAATRSALAAKGADDPSLPRPQLAGSRVLLADDQGGLRAPPSVAADITPAGELHQASVRAASVQSGDKSITHYTFEHSGGGRTEVIGRWSSEEKEPNSWEPLAVRARPTGGCFIVANRTHGQGQDRRSEIVLLEETRVVRTLASGSWESARLILDRAGQPVAFGRSRYRIVVARGGGVEELATNMDYDWSVARTGDGHVYVLSYDYDDRSLELRTARDGEWSWSKAQIDGAESGWQHSLAAYGSRVYVLYYYYRNSFNKGLRLAVLRRGQLETDHVYARERVHNMGWHPLLGISAIGRVQVRYLKNVEDEIPASDDFGSPAALLEHRGLEVTGGWEDRYKSIFFLGGPDVAYKFWKIWAPAPSGGEATRSYDAAYDYNPALVLGAVFEGRIGNWHLGLAYMRSLLEKEVKEQLGSVAGRAFQLFGGYLGYDKLLFGHDLRISTTVGRFDGVYRDEGGERLQSTDIRTLELGLLNQWRLRYGLQYRNYNLRQPIYGWYAPAGAAAYSFAGADVVDARVHRIEMFFGYSKLDYVAKYENYYNGLNLEVYIAGGIGVLLWDTVNLGGHSSSGTLALALTGSLRLNWLYYRRFYRLWGAGFFARLGYEVSYLMNGIRPGKPDDRKEDKDREKESLSVDAAHHQLFHGPFAGAGLVY